MKKALMSAAIILTIAAGCTMEDDPIPAESDIIGHTAINIADIPSEWIDKAKQSRLKLGC